MSYTLDSISIQTASIAEQLVERGNLRPGQLMVIGASTSEVAGKPIGTSGAMEIAAAIYEGLANIQRKYGVLLAFQCCEHLNRALVVEEETLERYRLEEVAAVPVPKAGGSMAAYAYRQLVAPCLVESIQAHAGIDIGDTLIGMHLRRVAVPFRPFHRKVGDAHVTAAFTRPQLIGGERAVYQLDHLSKNSNTSP